MDSVLILNTKISVTSVNEIAELLQKKDSKTIAICNTNTLVRSYKNSVLQEKINSLDVKTPDGFPVAKASKFLYKNNQPITTNRIAGLHNGILFHKKNLEIINSEKTQNYESFKAKSDSLDFFEKLDFKIKNENLPSENCFLNLIREFEGNFSISFKNEKFSQEEDIDKDLHIKMSQ